MERIEEFSSGGENFVYIDFSGYKSLDEFSALIEQIKPVIAKHPENSVNTITNIDSSRFDTDIKDIFVTYMKHNKPYVKYGVVIGMDGIKKIMANAVIKICGRKNMSFTFTREQAIEWVLAQKQAPARRP